MSIHETRSQQRADAVTITALRVVTGVIMATHGALKLLDLQGTVQSFTELGIPYPQYAVYFAVAGEFLGGLGLVLGLLTRMAALGTWSTMAVAIGYAHFGHGILAKNGGWEYPLVLGLVSLFFVTHGGGPASLDAWFMRNRNREPARHRVARARSYA